MSFVMTKAERESFLAGTHVAVVAVNRDGRAPLAVPVWYGYKPGGEIVICTGRGSVKEQLIRSAARFSVCVQDQTPPYQYVVAEGPVQSMEPSTFEQELAIARRYLSDGEAEAFVKSNTADQVAIRMRPEKWLSTDYGKHQG